MVRAGARCMAEASVMCKTLFTALPNWGGRLKPWVRGGELLRAGARGITASRREEETGRTNNNYMLSDTSQHHTRGVPGPHPSREPDAPRVSGQEKAHWCSRSSLKQDRASSSHKGFLKHIMTKLICIQLKMSLGWIIHSPTMLVTEISSLRVQLQEHCQCLEVEIV